MKTTNEVLAKTGLTYPMLNRLKDLGIIPRPRLKGRGRRKGVVGVFDDDIIGIISEVKSQQKSGLSLTQIAASRRGVSVPTPPEKREVTRVTPQNPAVMSNYIDTAPELFEQVESENPGYELHAIRMVVVKGESKKYLVPVELELIPKE
jgi:DNA-binding transcriptional MerR regulator